MTPLSDALTAAQRGWYAELMDANLSEAENHRWQRLVADGLSPRTALAVVLRAREATP